jgi:hypothetical protein
MSVTRRLFLVSCLGLTLAACAGEDDSPEARVRAVLAALEEGAQQRDAGAMKEHVSEGYRDAHGNDKRAVAQVVAFHLLRNQSVHLLVRVAEISLPAPGEARALAFVAMAGTPIEGPEALLRLRADLYRFDLQLREEEPGVWRVGSAQWRPAAVDDFR